MFVVPSERGIETSEEMVQAREVCLVLLKGWS